ncbi:MAG: hypothetical protein HY302_00945 [Opitutae bacterium]|nr:hypothetical protein [Opitutae bacterium]
MRQPASSFLLGFLVAGSAGFSAEPARLSPRLTEAIRAASPKFTPPPAPAPGPPAPAPAAGEPETSPDPDVVTLPKFFVEDSKLARLDPDRLLSKTALAAKQRREYLASLGPLEWALNCFSLPFLTRSVATRAREKYESERRAAEVSRLSDLLEVAGRVDPKAAAELRRELERR